MPRTALAFALIGSSAACAAGTLQPAVSAAPSAPARPAVDALQLKGEWRQGELIFGRTAPGAKVEFAGRSVRVSKDGDFVIGLDRDAPAKVELGVTPPAAAAIRREFAVAARTYDIQKIEGLPPAQVNPPPEVQGRIKQEQHESYVARMIDTGREDYLKGFTWPCTGRISGVYGSQRVLNGVAKQPHYGVDVAVPIGTEVRAPAAGVVTLAAPDMYYTGGTLMIDHGHGLTSAFLHLSKLRVKVGQSVGQGEVVAESGMTGRATGPHLDWRVSWFEARVDPQRLVDK